MFENKILKLVFQILPFVMIVVVIAIYLITGKGFTVETLLEYAPENYFWATIFILVLYAAKSFSVILPVSILNIAAGIIFPIVPALLLNTAGIAVCIVVSYFIGYYASSDYVEKQIAKYPKIGEFVKKQQKNEWFISYFLRVLPISCDMVSIYLGSLKTSFHKYFFAGMIGSLPGIVSSTVFGASVDDPLSPMCVISASSILVLSLLSYLIYRHIQKKVDASSDA